MRSFLLLLALGFSAFLSEVPLAQTMPFVYGVEDTGADCPAPPLPSYRDLPLVEALPDPFTWSDEARGRLTSRAGWRCRRAEIGAEIQTYEMGNKPAPPADITANGLGSTRKMIVIR